METWMLISDIQYPHQDVKAMELVMKVLDRFRCEHFDIVGDTDNADPTGRWVEGTPAEATSILDAGVMQTRKLLSSVNTIIPNADKHIHDGNHGWHRHFAYLQKKAPAFLEVVTADSLYQYTKYGFEWHDYSAPPVKRLGGYYVHHGDAISKHSAESVRNDMADYDVSLIRGHSHRLGAFYKTYPLTNKTLRGFELGHLADPSQLDFVRAPNWQQGFGFAFVDGDRVHMQVIEIVDNSCVVGGELFKA